MAVVTPDMRVRGVQRLRIIDLSVVPQLMSANTNAPAMAIGDRATDIIYGKAQEIEDVGRLRAGSCA
jgi:choline dehydrogenase